MSALTIKVIDKNGDLKKSHQGDDYLSLSYFEEYQLGDAIVVETEQYPIDLVVQFDETLAPSQVYLTESTLKFTIPMETNAKQAYSPKAFSGKMHQLSVRKAHQEEVEAYRNIALNPHDQNGVSGIYPHAVANVETRNDSTFFARNAIDGMIANEDHGPYPYQSWGINQQKDAEITIEFGRLVEIDKIQIVLRGDYPHDSYWTQVTFECSDGTETKLPLEKVLHPQPFTFETKQVEWVKLKELIKAEDESPFPALTELEVFGRPVK